MSAAGALGRSAAGSLPLFLGLVVLASSALGQNAPTDLKVTWTSSSEISLSWTAPTDDGQGAIDGYNILRCVEGNTPCTPAWIVWQDVSGGTSYTDSSVTAETLYRYTVQSTRSGNASAWSNQVTAVAAAVPTPTNLRVSQRSGTAIGLAWDAPTDTTHGAVDGYNILRCVEGNTACTPAWIHWQSGTGYSDTSVTSGTEYRYVVQATRSGVPSPWSNQVTALAEAPPAPNAPTNLRVTQRSGTMIGLAWDAPAPKNDGNGAVDGYNVLRCEEGGTPCTPAWIVWQGGTGYTDSGVTSGTEYRYAVQSTRLGVPSPWSNQVVALAETPPTPNAPTSLTTQQISDTEIALTWTPPANDGNGAVDGYNVLRCEEGGTPCTPAWIQWVGGTSYTDTGLTPGTNYRYAVQSTRLGVPSASSSEATAVAANPPPPRPPSNPTAKANPERVVVTWQHTEDPYDFYRVHRGDGDGCDNVELLRDHITKDLLSYEDRTVTSGTTYCYKVSALSNSGAGDLSEGVVVAAVAPWAPRGLTVAESSEESIELSWTPPGDDGGGTLDGYSVFRCEGSDCTPEWKYWVDPGATSYTDRAVKEGATYTYTVGASRLDWGSPWSNQIVAVAKSLEQAPAPTGLEVIGTSDGISLSWTAPADDGKGELLGYNLYRCEEGESPCEPQWLVWVDGASATSHVDTDVAADTAYRYAVGSSRGAGTESAWSNQVVAVAESLIQAPTALEVTGTSEESISLAWLAPPGVSVRGYNVLRCEEGESPCTLEWLAWVSAGADDPPPAPTMYTDASVQAGKAYRYAVEAKVGENYEGSPWSNQVVAAAESLVQAPAPTGLEVTGTSEESISLRWTAPEDDGHGELLGYNLYRCEEGGSPCEPEWLVWVDGASTTSYVDTGVTAGTTYRYAAGSSRGAGTESAWSNQVVAAAESLVQAPAPTGLEVTGTSEESVSLRWTAPEDDGHGELLGYNLYRCEEGGSPCEPEWLVWVDGASTTSYVDTGVTAGTTYRYAVGSSRGAGTESAWSNQVVAAAESLVQAPAPTGLEVAGTSEESVSLRWTAPEDDGHGELLGYNVYRCEEGGSPCEPEWLVWVDGASTTSYVDTGVTAGTTYRYAVGSSRGAGTESAWSNQVVAAAESLVQAPAPTGLEVAGTSEESVSLRWTAPEDDGHGELLGYNVYRCEEGGSPCEPEWLVWVDGASTTSYVDTGVTAGTTYRYAVGSSRGAGTESAWSNQVVAAAEDGPETSRSRLRRIGEELLGRQAFAIVDDTNFVIDRRLDSLTHDVSSQSTASVISRDDIAAAVVPSLASGTSGEEFDMGALLNNSSFLLPLGGSGSGVLNSMSIWGAGSYHDLSGSAGALDWSGDLVGVQVGADARLRPDLMAGVAVSWSEGSFDYREDDVAGSFRSEITSLHPYVGWMSRRGLRVWASGGFGEGEMEILDGDLDLQAGDTRLKTLAGGIGTKVLGWNTEDEKTAVSVRVRGEVAKVFVDVESDGLLDTSSVEASRARVALEGSARRDLGAERFATSSVELGWRQDQGDPVTAGAVEATMGFQYSDRRRGLTIDGRGRYAFSSEDNFSEWGANVSIRLDPGPSGEGVSLSVTPSYGVASGRAEDLWNQGVDRISAWGHMPRARVEAEIGYGFAGSGRLITPFGAVAQDDAISVYRLGGKFRLQPGFDFRVEGERRDGIGLCEYGIRLTGTWRPAMPTRRTSR